MSENLETKTEERQVEVNPNFNEAEVWECTANNCNGWMRKSFALEESPTCPICQSDMRHNVREIPKVKKKITKKNIFFGRGLKH